MAIPKNIDRRQSIVPSLRESTVVKEIETFGELSGADTSSLLKQPKNIILI